MRLERYKAERKIERSADKEAFSKLVLSDIMWDLQNDQDHGRLFSPETFKPRASNDPRILSHNAHRRSECLLNPIDLRASHSVVVARKRKKTKKRCQGRRSPDLNRFGANANQQNNMEAETSSVLAVLETVLLCYAQIHPKKMQGCFWMSIWAEIEAWEAPLNPEV